jgi:hypothetical protein
LLELSLPFAVPAQLLKLLAAAVAFRYIRRLTNYSHTKTLLKVPTDGNGDSSKTFAVDKCNWNPGPSGPW